MTAHSRRTTKAFANHVSIALGSQGELETCLDLAVRLGFLRAPEASRLLSSANSVGRLLYGLYRSLERKLRLTSDSRPDLRPRPMTSDLAVDYPHDAEARPVAHCSGVCWSLRACDLLLVAQEAAVSETVKLQKMTARFAPTEITADLSTLSATDRQVLAKLVQASKILDALFLRQVWAGNEPMLLDLVRDQTRRGARAPALLSDEQGTVVAARSQRAVRARRAGQAGGREFLSGRAPRRPSSNAGLPVVAERRARARATGFFTVDPSCHRRDVQRRALQRGVPERAGPGGDAPARGCRDRHRADAQGVSDQARRRVSLERLLRQRRRVDGTEGRDRADDRSVRGVRGRVVQLRKPRSSRSSRSATKRRAPSCRSSAASFRTSRITCRSIRSIATRSSAALAPLVVVNEIFAAGDANRGVQTAAFNLPNDERVVAEKGSQARDAEERAGREVRQDAACRFRRWSCRRPTR